MLQIVVQLVSVYGAISSLRRKFGAKGALALVHRISENYDKKFKCCFLFDCVFKWIAIAFYGIFLVLVSVFLGITKLIAIKQMQRWWLRWIIVDYDEALEKTETIQSNEDIQKTMHLDSLPSLSLNSSNSGKKRARTMSDVDDEQSEAEDELDDFDEEEEEEGGCFACMKKTMRWINDRTPDALLKYKIEANVYNAYFVSELIVESLPQLVCFGFCFLLCFVLVCLKLAFLFLIGVEYYKCVL